MSGADLNLASDERVQMDAAAAPVASAPPPQRLDTTYRPKHPFDFWTVLGTLRMGRNDPAHLHDGRVFWRVSRTPEGVATLALGPRADGSVNASAWGAGARWAIEQLPTLLGALDDSRPFEAHHHPLIAEVHRRNPGLRLARTDLVFDALVASIIEQKVTGMQAYSAWRSLLTTHGERAPGPTPRPMFAPPSVAQWQRMPSWELHRAGLEPPQARTIVECARRGERLVVAAVAAGTAVADVTAGTSDTAGSAAQTAAEAGARAAATSRARERVLMGMRGVGVWTAAETRIRAFGDPDAVSFGDYHLSHGVGFALTGTRVDDDGMRELLEPWSAQGQRQRVIRLIGLSGMQEPRRGPRLHPEDHRER